MPWHIHQLLAAHPRCAEIISERKKWTTKEARAAAREGRPVRRPADVEVVAGAEPEQAEVAETPTDQPLGTAVVCELEPVEATPMSSEAPLERVAVEEPVGSTEDRILVALAAVVDSLVELTAAVRELAGSSSETRAA